MQNFKGSFLFYRKEIKMEKKNVIEEYFKGKITDENGEEGEGAILDLDNTPKELIAEEQECTDV